MKLISFAMILPVIKATPKKICKDCKFFIANEKRCMKFYDIDLVTGKKYFESAFYMRSDNNKCGENAKDFEKNNFKFLTIPYYYTLTNWHWYPAFFYGFWIIAILNINK